MLDFIIIIRKAAATPFKSDPVRCLIRTNDESMRTIDSKEGIKAIVRWCGKGKIMKRIVNKE
jgi:hypothetical protein